MKKQSVIICVFLFLLNCNNNVSKSKESKQPDFLVEINFKSNNNGILKIMLNNIVIDEFQKKDIH